MDPGRMVLRGAYLKQTDEGSQKKTRFHAAVVGCGRASREPYCVHQGTGNGASAGPAVQKGPQDKSVDRWWVVRSGLSDQRDRVSQMWYVVEEAVGTLVSYYYTPIRLF
jgi:hypothetical protein